MEALFEWDNPIVEKHKPSWRSSWMILDAKMKGLSARKRKRLTDEMNSNCKDTGCNLCRKKTLNSQVQPSLRTTSRNRKGAQYWYRGVDNNSIGNMLYLAQTRPIIPCDASRLSLIVIQHGRIIEVLSEEDLPENPVFKDIRFSVWEGCWWCDCIWGRRRKIHWWNNYLLGTLVKDGRIVKDHVEKSIAPSNLDKNQESDFQDWRYGFCSPWSKPQWLPLLRNLIDLKKHLFRSQAMVSSMSFGQRKKFLLRVEIQAADFDNYLIIRKAPVWLYPFKNLVKQNTSHAWPNWYVRSTHLWVLKGH